MACCCMREAAYCLYKAGIPGNIFRAIECNKCKNARSGYVSFLLLPDSAVSNAFGFVDWQTSYHGTSVENVRSILDHGELLMQGDVLCSGREIRKNLGAEEWKPAIFTNPDRKAAELAALPQADNSSEMEFKVILCLRQQPGTYEIKQGEAFGGYKLWSTNRRGTIFIEALEVLVTKCDKYAEPHPVMPIDRRRFVATYDCPFQFEMFNLLQTLNLPRAIFDSKCNMCYCESNCYLPNWHKSEVAAGETYTVPSNWARFGLAVNPLFERMHDIWKSWPTAFHGCHPDRLGAIVSSRNLLIPGDVLPDGSTIKDGKRGSRYYLSPEIMCASHPMNARPKRFRTRDGTAAFSFQTVLVFKVRPGSYDKQEDSEVAGMKLCASSVIPEKEMEWVSARRGCTHPIAILVRKLPTGNAEELKKLFPFPADFDVDSLFC